MCKNALKFAKYNYLLYNILEIEVEFMWFENVVIILTWFIILTLYLKICIKKKNVVNFILVCLDILFTILYFTINNVNIQENADIIKLFALLFMYIIPLIAICLYHNNMAIKYMIICVLAKFYYNMGRYDIATKLYIYSIKKNKKSITSDNYYILGRCLRKEKRYLDSRDMLIEAIELDKNNFMAYYELGLTLTSSDKKDTAIIMFSNSLKINPDFKEAKVALAITYSEIGRYKEAIALYNEIIEKDEADEEVWYNLANIYHYEMGDTVKAEECYREATNINNKSYAAWFNLGLINYLKGDYGASINALEIVRQSEIFKDKAEYNLAKSYVACNNNEKAIKLLKKLIQRDESYIDKIKGELIFEAIVPDIINIEN